jgi:hypothetical protein
VLANSQPSHEEMHMQQRMTFIITLFAAHAIVAPLRAQAALTARQSSCTYAECAVRFEPGAWTQHLVRGASGRTVGKLGWFNSSAIDSLMAGSDSAAANARVYVSESRKSSAYWLVGTASLVFALIHTKNTQEVHAVDWSALTLALLTLGPAGRHASNATASLSRSVWWYNSTLPR